MGWMKTSEALVKAPELLFFGRLSFSFDRVPLVSNRLSLRQRVNLIRAGVDTVFRQNRVYSLPIVLQIEPTNMCNLQCALCPTGTGSMKRPRGVMSYDTFERIMGEVGDSLVLAILYGWGEPFLNKDLARMIEACTARNIRTLTSTNGHCLQTLEDALNVVDAGLSALIIAIDGSTREIYSAYRKGGDIEKVKRCVALVEEAKARRGSKLPYTNLRIVLTRANQEDLPGVERLALDLGVNMVSYKTLGCLTENEKFKDYEPETADMRRFEYQGASRKRKALVRCPYPFRQPTVFWDGTMVGCEFDYDLTAPWGRLGEQSFSNIWNGVRALELRHSVRSGKARPAFCSPCPYRDRVQDGSVLVCRELRPAGTIRRDPIRETYSHAARKDSNAIEHD